MPKVTKSEQIGVLDNKVTLCQPASGFRTSLDSVMLAAACPAKGYERVLDMGCGVGGAAFCLLYRLPEIHVTGVDVEAEYIDCAQENIALNKAAGRCDFIQSDIREFTVENPQDRFDHIICNPPYLEAGAHIPSPDPVKAGAMGHQDSALSVREWVGAALRLLKSHGSLTMIHRADAVDRIIAAMGKSFGAVEIIPLWPKRGRDAKRVIIRAIKDRKSPATFHAGLVLHNQDGTYTDAANQILRDGQGLL